MYGEQGYMGKPPEVRVVEETEKLIGIESITGNEGAVMDYLARRLEEIGCRVKVYEAAPGRPNVYAEAGGRAGEKPAILFHGHLDTVPGYGMEKPFTPVIRDGKLYGRGTADQKGGVAAVITAFEEILSRGKEEELPSRPFAFVGVIDEESEHRGSMALKKMGVDADFAIITEPSDMQIGVGCKGTAPFLLEVRGKAAHGCRPWLGKNAVIAGIAAADALLQMELPVLELEGMENIRASLNLGRIEGGEAYNSVPDLCSIWFDRRLLPGESQTEVIAGMQAVLGSLPALGGYSWELKVARPDWNWKPIEERGLHPAATDLQRDDVQNVKAVHRECFAREPGVYFTDGYHEMDFLVNDLGINAIQYGPGKGALCHTDEEHVDTLQLGECARAYGALIRRFCR